MTPYWTRPIQDEDRPVIAAWIAFDPDHKDKMDSEFFFKTGHMALAMGEHDNVGLFLRMDAVNVGVLRLHIQFGPDRLRSGKTLLRGWPAFRWGCEQAGIRWLLFDSMSDSLVGFCKRCFGFREVAGVPHLYALEIGKLEGTECAVQVPSRPN